MASDKFCLKWNDFESSLSSAFRDLRAHRDFLDVTLSCGNEQIQAHKVILSACSSFFRDILSCNPHQHPLLYLKGVNFADLQSVLDFMYHGEVNVAQEDLNSFLAVAEDLKVKGLTQNNSEAVRRENNPYSQSSPIVKSSQKPEKIIRLQPTKPGSSRIISSAAVDDDIEELVPVKSEPKDCPPPRQAIVPEYYSHHPATEGTEQYYNNYEDYNSLQNDYHSMEIENGTKDGAVDAKIDSLLGKSESGLLQCLVCGKTSNIKQNIRNHIETHVATEGFTCNFCGKPFKTRNSLNNHKSLYHK